EELTRYSSVLSCEPKDSHDLNFLTFLPCWHIFVRRFLVLLLAPQVAGVDRHSGFNLLLRQLHALIKHLEEFF
uniref:Uncharacterized protein n=1 Tax=Poecilia reticulata TaxID=8081 RepID=A0A3P9QCZ4_POERE